MTFPSYSDSPSSPTRYLGQNYRFAPTYIRNRDPANGTDGTPFTSPDIRPKENQGYYPVGSFWINKVLNRLWSCTSFGVDANSNTCAHWELIESSGITGTEQFNIPSGGPITPTGIPPHITFQDGTGISISQGTDIHSIKITNTGTATNFAPDTGTNPVSGATVTFTNTSILATGTLANALRSNGTGASTIAYQTQYAGMNAGASGASKWGVAQFDQNQFNVVSGFVQLAGGTTAPILGAHPDTFTGPGTDPVVPDGSGNIKLEGGATFATNTQANPIRTNSLAANTIDFQIQLAGMNPGASGANKFGVSQFDQNQFTVTSGFVQLKGAATAPVLGITPDASTPPGTSPVVPNGSGNIKIEGGATFSSGTQANPIRTNSLAANTMDLQIQLAGMNASVSTPNNFGVSQFDSNDFTVTSGFVQLKGGSTPAIQQITASDTNHVTPSGTPENVNIQGSGSITTTADNLQTLTVALTGLTNHAVLVGAGTATITKVGPTANTGAILQNNSGADPSYSTATYPSTTTINQILYSTSTNAVGGLATSNSSVLATTSTGVPIWQGPMTNGQVLIGNTGGTPVVNTLTGTGGITITNGAGNITITGSGTGLTWIDEAVNFNATANNGYFCTATLTATLPPAPTQGTVVDIVCDVAAPSQITIQANTGQFIRIGSSISASAGTAKNSKQGDSVSLVFRNATNTWISVGSPTGSWTVT